MLPDGLRRQYQGALLSADPALAVSGAVAIDMLAKIDPALIADIPAGQQRHAAAIAECASLDLPPERAVELAEAEVEEETPEADLAAATASWAVN